MRALLQRVSEASVTVEGERIGSIGHGLLVLLAIGEGDTDDDLAFITAKIPALRLFEDEQGRMGRSLEETGGASFSSASSPSTPTSRVGGDPASSAPCSPPPPARSSTAQPAAGAIADSPSRPAGSAPT